MNQYKSEVTAMCVKPPSALSISSRNSSPSGKIEQHIIDHPHKVGRSQSQNNVGGSRTVKNGKPLVPPLDFTKLNPTKKPNNRNQSNAQKQKYQGVGEQELKDQLQKQQQILSQVQTLSAENQIEVDTKQ